MWRCICECCLALAFVFVCSIHLRVGRVTAAEEQRNGERPPARAEHHTAPMIDSGTRFCHRQRTATQPRRSAIRTQAEEVKVGYDTSHITCGTRAMSRRQFGLQSDGQRGEQEQWTMAQKWEGGRRMRPTYLPIVTGHLSMKM